MGKAIKSVARWVGNGLVSGFAAIQLALVVGFTVLFLSVMFGVADLVIGYGRDFGVIVRMLLLYAYIVFFAVCSFLAWAVLLIILDWVFESSRWLGERILEKTGGDHE